MAVVEEKVDAVRYGGKPELSPAIEVSIPNNLTIEYLPELMTQYKSMQ